MALSTTTNKVIHSGNASATVFPFTFPIPDASYLSVIYTSAAGVETTLSPSLYSATGIGTTTGGSVTYPLSGSPIAASTLLTLVRTVPYTQPTVIANQGGYYPEVVEAVFDRLTMEIQQLAEIVGRVTVSSISNPATEQSNYALIQTLQTFQTGIDKLTTAGDSLSHNGTSYVRLARGGASQYLGVSGTALAWKTFVTPQVRGHLSGLTLSTAGSSATFGIAVGAAADSTNAAMMALTSAYTKTTSAWAVGSGNGSLDTGAIANSTWYHVHLIQRVDTGVVDVLISLSATAPTMPANYTLSRRIGSIQTNGSAQWVRFNQQGDRFDRLAVSDFTISGTSAATLRTLSVPTGVVVLPICYTIVLAVNNTNTIVQVAPAADATLLVNAAFAYEGAAAEGSGSGTYFYAPPTNTSGQIYVAVPSYSNVSSLSTSGWIDRRGQDA